MVSRQPKISIAKTAQTANTLKLIMGGQVVGSVTVIDPQTAELKDHRERLLGTYSDAATAIAQFEKDLEIEEIHLDS